MAEFVSNLDGIKILKNMVKHFCGLTFEGQRDTYFRQKVKQRMRSLGLKSPLDYHRYLVLEHQGVEWQIFISEITINESYFFREQQQFDFLLNDILPRLKSQLGPITPIRMLSAGCANGSEPYSLAILLRHHRREQDGQFQIEACDLSDSNLVTAQQGIYNQFDLRNTPPLIKAGFFEKTGDRYLLHPDIRCQVSFFKMNLLDASPLKIRQPYHVIFCRNVLYYFELPVRELVIRGLANFLSRNGYLLVGQTEFLGGLSIPLHQHRKGNVIFYRFSDQ